MPWRSKIKSCNGKKHSLGQNKKIYSVKSHADEQLGGNPIGRARPSADPTPSCTISLGSSYTGPTSSWSTGAASPTPPAMRTSPLPAFLQAALKGCVDLGDKRCDPAATGASLLSPSQIIISTNFLNSTPPRASPVSNLAALQSRNGELSWLMAATRPCTSV